MSAFFDATATMYRAAPWRVVPADCVFSVTVGALDIHDFALAVIGEAGRDGGWLVCPGLDAFEELMEQVDAYEPGDDVEPPPHLALHFEAASELPPGLWSEAEDNRWALANPAAYPRLVVVGEAGRLHPPAPEDVVLAEAVSRALTHAVAEKGALLAAFEAGEPMTRTFSVATEQGDLDVTLTAPFLHPSHLLDPSGDLIEALAELTEDGELDLDAYQALEQAVSDRFEASPEAEGLELKYLYRTVMEFGAQYLGETIATLSADALGELLFEVFPRKLSIDPKEAGAIIDETRALYRFLQREFDLPQAKACLSVLGPSSARRLEAALADKSKYGMAKAMVMAGLDAGVDMSSQESLEAWMRSMEGKPLPPSIPLPAARVAAPSKKALAAKKAKRKAARKARKRNK
ncbi:MAG: hypothetical protein KC933_28715 [Myxococcales bacterium]|nr:hypothetical protein [Myxococcales bacterium]